MNRIYRFALSLAVVTAAAAARFLLPQHDLTANPFITFYPAVAAAALLAGFWPGLVATGLSTILAHSWIAPDRPQHPDIPSMVTFVAGGALVSYIALIRDRTSKLELSLREDRERHALFVEHAPAALAMFDREMRYLCTSRRWVAEHGLENREIIGRSHYDVFPETPQERREVHRRGLAGEVVSAQAEPFVLGDGSVQWRNWEIRPWYQADRSIGGIVIFTEDVTQRKLHEDQLRELTQRLTYHIDNSPLAVVERGPDMRLTRWAGAAERIFGWTAEEVVGKRINEHRWVFEDDEPMVIENIKKLAEGTIHSGFSTNRNYRKDGRVAFCEWYTSSLIDDEGRVRSVLSLGLDVTERNLLKEKLQRQTEALESTVRERTAELIEKNRLLIHQSRFAAMGEMLNSIAHQWRQPLNVLGIHIQDLSDFCEMGAKDDIDGSIRNCMKIIQHMSRTIDDFRDFFRPEKEAVQFCINSSIEQAIDLIQSGSSHNITIDTSISGAAIANGYPNEFAQAILCILQNARDAIIERDIAEGRISIRSFPQRETRCITIGDNAGGVPEEIQWKIFDPYFSTKGVLGSGIGLYMARTIIEKMGGTISVRNAVEGAEFTIEIHPHAYLSS